jgi:GNAT superfamily N-acetyltransferase
LEAWESELAISADYIAREHVQLLASEAEVVGFYGLELRRTVALLEHLWIEPAHMRRGLGSHLLRLACETARAAGHHSLELVADPNAESFYLRNGAVRIGAEHSRVLGHPRVLPRLRLRLLELHPENVQ